ncbi:AAA family ATPase [Leucobacter chinensis]|uniref:AAA family ATPase n=1 Tax=Leucobacter chinensis TaxID=2851010 RepID=UPI001C23B2A2|nr:MoxR family ATPase [Leucobacter chinensis]
MSTLSTEQRAWFAESFSKLVANVEQVVLGKRHVIELAFTAMVAEGHLLLEDMPGTGKTSLARAMGKSVQGVSTRIQFTPDLLPGDVTGMTVYDQQKAEFEFHAGPIFANVVLADEINRASPKTQSALLEAMEERQVTVDGVTRQTGAPFLVVATQNPVEQAGTYRLPEAQLDRFLLKTSLGYPDHATTVRILEASGSKAPELHPVMTLQGVLEMTELAKGVFIDPLVMDYIVRIVEATRNAAQVRLGASVRAALGLTRAAKVWALAHDRDFVTPDDVKGLAEVTLAHRLVLDPEAEFEGVTAGAVIGQILLDTKPPTQGAEG